MEAWGLEVAGGGLDGRMRCIGVHIASATSGERPEKLIMG